MSNGLLPTWFFALELAAAEACAELAHLSVPLVNLWDPETCPAGVVALSGMGIFGRSLGQRTGQRRQNALRIQSAWFIHKHKGTIGACKRVVEPLGYVINVTEWWETHDVPGTFRTRYRRT